MLRSLIVLSVSICALGASISDDDPVPRLNGRIVGGAIARIESYPWQVSIQRNGNHFCGGSIYSNDIIVTAAHCLQTVAADVLKVRAGSSTWNSGGVLIPVASFKIHEDYNARNMINDIAVMRLASPLTYSAAIRSIPLASKAPADGAVAAVSGWGTTSYGSSKVPSRLQSVKVNIVGQNQCASNSYGYGSQVISTMICASASGKDSCQGDSGGPLVSGGVLAGVVSWGYGCAFPNYPGVYSDVADLRPWVINAAAKI